MPSKRCSEDKGQPCRGTTGPILAMAQEADNAPINKPQQLMKIPITWLRRPAGATSLAPTAGRAPAAARSQSSALGGERHRMCNSPAQHRHGGGLRAAKAVTPAGLEERERHNGRAATHPVNGHVMSHSMRAETRVKLCCMAPRQSCRCGWPPMRLWGAARQAGAPRRDARRVYQRVARRSRAHSGCSCGSTGQARWLPARRSTAAVIGGASRPTTATHTCVRHATNAGGRNAAHQPASGGCLPRCRYRCRRL